MPDLSGETGIDAQQTLEDLGLNVTVQKSTVKMMEQAIQW